MAQAEMPRYHRPANGDKSQTDYLVQGKGTDHGARVAAVEFDDEAQQAVSSQEDPDQFSLESRDFAQADFAHLLVQFPWPSPPGQATAFSHKSEEGLYSFHKIAYG